MKRNLWLLLPMLLFACAHQVGPRGGSPPMAESVIRRRPLPPGCQQLSSAQRTRILEEADPTNFPATRYRRGPSAAKGVEKETDCSHFVHEVYRRAGLPYGFLPTAHLGNANEFDILPEREARPGDLMLFKGHVGIVDEEGKIISALRTRHRRRKSSIEAIDRKHFRTFRGQRYVLRYRCLPSQNEPSRVTASERSP